MNTKIVWDEINRTKMEQKKSEIRVTFLVLTGCKTSLGRAKKSQFPIALYNIIKLKLTETEKATIEYL